MICLPLVIDMTAIASFSRHAEDSGDLLILSSTRRPSPARAITLLYRRRRVVRRRHRRGALSSRDTLQKRHVFTFYHALRSMARRAFSYRARDFTSYFMRDFASFSSIFAGLTGIRVRSKGSQRA